MNSSPLLLPRAEGKIAFVTGAGGGIGRAVAALFRDAGVKVAAADLEGLSEPVEGYLPLKMDATDERQIIGAIGSAAFRLGRLDYVVHCVGAGNDGPLADMALEDWRRAIDASLTSAFLVAKQARTRMVNPGGVLILAAANAGTAQDTPDSSPVCSVARTGMASLTRHLAEEWAPDGLRVNCLVTGRSGPMGDSATADQIAAHIAFLCSEHAANVTGAVADISGGLVLD